MSGKRKAITKKLRFEVFKRDRFTCQYCGASGGDGGTILHVDHILAVSRGGTNELMNLVTACQDWNLGKGATKLTDDAAVKKQKRFLDDLAAKREQTAMMLKWREELRRTTDEQFEYVCRLWTQITGGWHFNEFGRGTIRKYLDRYGFEEVCDAMEIVAQYILCDSTGKAHDYSVEFTFQRLGGVLFNRRRDGRARQG